MENMKERKNFNQLKIQEILQTLQIDDFINMNGVKVISLPKLDEHLTGFHFLSDNFQPIELVEFYKISVNNNEEHLARVYCCLTQPEGVKSFIPTIILGSKDGVAHSTRRDGVIVSDFGNEIHIGNRIITTHDLANIPGMRKVLEIDNISFAIRPSSLRLSEVHLMNTHMQLRIFRDLTDTTSGNFVALISHLNPSQEVIEGVQCIMLTNITRHKNSRREV